MLFLILQPLFLDKRCNIVTFFVMISYFVIFYLTNLNILQATNNMKIKNNETNKYKYRKNNRFR